MVADAARDRLEEARVQAQRARDADAAAAKVRREAIDCLAQLRKDYPDSSMQDHIAMMAALGYKQ